MNLFKWMRENPESIPLLEEQAKEIGRLREELEKVRSELRHAHLGNSISKSECDRLKERLKMFESAKEKGCVRGEYCRNCVHGTLVSYSSVTGEKCVCTYGECAHFSEKAGAL